jgi:hypothetical protein
VAPSTAQAGNVGTTSNRPIKVVNEDTAIYLAGPDDLPPTSVADLDGWEPTGEILDLNLGQDGWVEAWVLHRTI